MSFREAGPRGDISNSGNGGSFAGSGERPTRGPVQSPDVSTRPLPPRPPQVAQSPDTTVFRSAASASTAAEGTTVARAANDATASRVPSERGRQSKEGEHMGCLRPVDPNTLVQDGVFEWLMDYRPITYRQLAELKKQGLPRPRG